MQYKKFTFALTLYLAIFSFTAKASPCAEALLSFHIGIAADAYTSFLNYAEANPRPTSGARVAQMNIVRQLEKRLQSLGVPPEQISEIHRDAIKQGRSLVDAEKEKLRQLAVNKISQWSRNILLADYKTAGFHSIALSGNRIFVGLVVVRNNRSVISYDLDTSEVGEFTIPDLDSHQYPHLQPIARGLAASGSNVFSVNHRGVFRIDPTSTEYFTQVPFTDYINPSDLQIDGPDTWLISSMGVRRLIRLRKGVNEPQFFYASEDGNFLESAWAYEDAVYVLVSLAGQPNRFKVLKFERETKKMIDSFDVLFDDRTKLPSRIRIYDGKMFLIHSGGTDLNLKSGVAVYDLGSRTSEEFLPGHFSDLVMGKDGLYATDSQDGLVLFRRPAIK